MNPQELLATAKREYPVGTEFISAYNNTVPRIVQKGDHRLLQCDNGTAVTVDSANYVYYEGKWAIITKRVAPAELPIFN